MPTPILVSFVAYWHAFGITWLKQKLTNRLNKCKGSHDTTLLNIVMREFQLVPLSLTYTMTLSNWIQPIKPSFALQELHQKYQVLQIVQ
jgi:hypothetical protein